MMEREANEGKVQIIKEFDIDTQDILADSRAVKQMLINLLSNAIKFSPEKSKVIVRAQLNDQTTTLEVIDQGIGISSSDLPKLCNPFVQADNSYKREHEGVGLGLSVVKGLAQLHGGNLTIESTLGIGTTARIELPFDASELKVSPSDLTRDLETETQKPESCVISFDEKVQDLKKTAQAAS
jgi:cell cycle sensor histidine kinase DivJ